MGGYSTTRKGKDRNARLSEKRKGRGGALTWSEKEPEKKGKLVRDGETSPRLEKRKACQENEKYYSDR